MTTDEAVGRSVHQAIWDSRSTQSKVAAALGVDQSALSRKLRGKRPWYAHELVDIAGVIGVPVSRFFESAPGTTDR